jgi:uncharacterized membrane protein
MNIDEQALALLKRNGSASVAKLFADLKMRNPSITESETTDLVWRLAEKGRVDVEDVPPAVNSLSQYLKLWERNLSFYVSIAVSLLTVVVIYSMPTVLPWVAVRWVLGSVFVLFIPGYVTVEALFPKGRDLDGIERFALSVGLSLALVPLIGLLLNYTPWGIRLDPIVISLTILTVALTGVALERRFRMSVERFELENLK